MEVYYLLTNKISIFFHNARLFFNNFLKRVLSSLCEIIRNSSKQIALYGIFILFLNKFLNLEQSVKLRAVNSHNF